MTQPVETEPTRRCTFCGSPLITDGARICHVCRSWQKSWQNYLVFLGGSAGLLALAITAATYVVSAIYTKMTQARDAAVLELQYPGNQIVTNSGTVPLMLSHYQFTWGENTSIVMIGKEIEPGKVLAHKDDVSAFRHQLAPEAYVATANGDGTSLLAYASPDFYKCYLMVFFSKSAPELQYLHSYFKGTNVKLATAPIDDASLVYYPTDEPTPIPRKFEAVAAFYKLKGKAKCPSSSQIAHNE